MNGSHKRYGVELDNLAGMYMHKGYLVVSFLSFFSMKLSLLDRLFYLWIVL